MLIGVLIKHKWLIPSGLFAVVAILLAVSFAPEFIKLTSNVDELSNYLKELGSLGIIMFIFLQIVQVVVAFIPGDLLHISGGFVYGTAAGAVFSYIGVMIGATIAFYLARILGNKIVIKLIGEKSYKKFSGVLNTSTASLTVFLICIIPGIPKDVLVYLAGLTPIKPVKFLSLYAVARVPGILISSSMGANINEGHYQDLVILVSIVVVALVAGLFVKKKILRPKY